LAVKSGHYHNLIYLRLNGLHVTPSCLELV